MSYIVHKYYVHGLPHPLDRIEAIFEQRRLYWNALVEVERAYLAEVATIIGESSPEADQGA